MVKKFIRQDYMRYSKIGKGRKKLQKWRRPKGRHSKMRLKRKSYPASPNIGYASPKKELGKINGMSPVLVHNLKDMRSLEKNNLIIISGKVGAKKRLEMIKLAEEMKLKVHNLPGGSK